LCRSTGNIGRENQRFDRPSLYGHLADHHSEQTAQAVSISLQISVQNLLGNKSIILSHWALSPYVYPFHQERIA
jgi:hypothetical protein